MQMPLFPLGRVVLPGGLMPLRLFEPRYIDMVKDCFRYDSGFGICLIKQGVEAGGRALPYPLGTRVSIIDFDQGADGLLHIVCQGEEEFRVLSYFSNDSGLLIAEVELIPEQPATPMLPEYELLAQKLSLILKYLGSDMRFEEQQLENADWISYRLLEVLPLTHEARYELLQMGSNTERLKALTALQIEIAER